QQRADRAPQGRRAGRAEAFDACPNQRFGTCLKPAARPVVAPARVFPGVIEPGVARPSYLSAPSKPRPLALKSA
ncbi:MAG TPA: hypothetical protein VJS18_08115, partial [Paraburkholderia sp.]|nr:hypothetical protein [Paraburkholderia sp.]